jgi:hypothetical protein
MSDEWDFFSTKKENTLITCQGWTSQVKLTREIQVCEVSQGVYTQIEEKRW